MEYQVRSVPSGTEADDVYEPYGVVNEFFHYFGPECILAGPYDTGKTFGALHKLVTMSWMYRDARVAVVRDTYASLKSSAMVTLWDKVLKIDPNNLTKKQEKIYNIYGGGSPEVLTFKPTGTRWRFGGLDNPQRILSSEYDFIFIPQAEELNVDQYEQLTGRCNGRSGNTPFNQIISDANPDVPEHWIPNRERLMMFNTNHLDNPTIYARDKAGNLIPEEGNHPHPYRYAPGGRERIETLMALTGLRYKRGFLGLWVGAEGAVYENFDSNVHVIDRHPIPEDWRKYRVIDFGYTHPFVCQWWAQDDFGNLIMYREMYMTGRTVGKHAIGDDVAKGIIQHTGDERIRATVCDHDAEGRATLEEYGIRTVKADKRVQVGIEKVQDRLKRDENGVPGIMIMKDSLVEVDNTLADHNKPTNVVEEFPGYVWANVGNKVESAKDEKPIKKNDHGMDAMRYLVMYFDGKARRRTVVRRYA